MKSPANHGRRWMAALSALTLSVCAFSLIIQPSEDNYGVARFVNAQPDHHPISDALPIQFGQ